MWLIVSEWLLRIAMAPIIILRKRSPAVALAWLVVVAFVPLLGAIVYFLLGENRLAKRHSARRQSLNRRFHVPGDGSPAYLRIVQPLLKETFRPLVALAETAGAGQPLGGNELTLLSNFEELVEGLTSDIDAARENCHLLYYIFNDDKAGEAVSAALIKATQRGVTCRLLVDAVGSKDFLQGDLLLRLRAAGVLVEAALPVSALRVPFARLDLRNHRKLALIDGRVAYTGSHNISEPIYPRKAAYGAWVDATVRLCGPTVARLQDVFLEDWQYTTEETLPQAKAPLSLPEASPHADIAVQVLPSGPHTETSPLLDVVLQAVAAAKEQVIFTTPYFVPNEIIVGALRSAASRGVEVILVLPKYSDSPLAQAAGRSHHDYLLGFGVKIHEFKGGLLHSKTLTVDRDFAIIGSANLDDRSFHLNFELELLVYDSDFSSQLRFLQQSYLEESEPLSLETVRNRSLARRFLDNAAKLLTPLL